MRKRVMYLIMVYSLFILFVSTPGFINAQEQAGSSVSQDPFREQALMDTYQGPTVTISGKLIFPAYKQGQQIKIVVKALPAKGKETTLIAVADLSQPGDYSLKVPSNFGEIYINMVVLEPVKQAPDAYMPIARLGKFLKVGSSDIKGVDIAI